MASKKNDAKRSVSVNVSLRLDPKTKYLIDLLARDQKRTITGVIEWALEKAASDERIDYQDSDSESFTEAINDLWSTDEATRLIKLALYKQSLLDYDEMRLWETIRATEQFWKVQIRPTSDLNFINLHIDSVQKHWDDLVEHVNEHRNSRAIVPFRPPECDAQQNPSIKDKNDELDPYDDSLPF